MEVYRLQERGSLPARGELNDDEEGMSLTGAEGSTRVIKGHQAYSSLGKLGSSHPIIRNWLEATCYRPSPPPSASNSVTRPVLCRCSR
eukprot:10894403-Alexandrium_andersonii.AAC.1